MEITWKEIQKGFSSFIISPEKWQAILKYQNRFSIPQGLDKKELNKLLKNTQQKINECLERCRKLGPGNNILADIEREDYVIKKAKIKKILQLHSNFGSIQKAKQYPIENLLEFNNAGFANCPFHGPEKTNSLKLYRERNKAHCFGCEIDADSIDIFMKVNNINLTEAVKRLTN